jgi:hypothetical protein
MKKMIALVLAMALLLCGCGGKEPENVTNPTTNAPATEAPATQAPSVEATDAPATEAPVETTEPTTEAPIVYRNPLTGEIVDEPFRGRIFAVSINNLEDALPHKGVYQADMFLEMFVNHSIIRGLALYTDIASVESIGSVRSTRPIFTDIAGHYDCFVAHAGGSDEALRDQRNSGIDNMNIDTQKESDYSYRDQDRVGKYSFEHTLFVKGEGLLKKVEEKGIRTTQDPGKSYGLNFTEDGTPAGGEKASSVTISFNYRGSFKDTVMVYDETLGGYVYNQYGMEMRDDKTGDKEVFENVIIVIGTDKLDAMGYHIFDFLGGGEGFYACGGRLIPITWACAGEHEPLTFYTLDGEPLQIGVGSTYMGIAATGSKVVWE